MNQQHPIRPMEMLMSEALELAKNAPSSGEDFDERDGRTPSAQRIRDRLPAFLRHTRPAELEQRISDHRLRERARAWRVGGKGVLFLGPTGVGKSHAAALVFRRVLGDGWRSGGAAWEFALGLRWFSAAALSQARREHPLGHGDAPEITRAGAATLLVIDDAGWDRDPSAVSDVLAERYERARPTLITSGLKSDELIKHYEAAVVRRFVESGGGSAAVVDCFAAFPTPENHADQRYP